MRTSGRASAAVAALAWAAPAAATVSVYVSPAQLAEHAPIVVIGEVASARVGVEPVSERVATWVRIDVETVLRGPELELVELREPGGGGALDGAAPRYVRGERVLVYLDAGADGALHTMQHFYGKLTLITDADGAAWAVRRLAGRAVLGAPGTARVERFPLAELVAEIRAASRRGTPPVPPFAGPPEGTTYLAPAADFTVGADQARWFEADADVPVPFDVERARDPLGDGAEAAARVGAALAAWTDVAAARIALTLGDDDADYTATHPFSPRLLPPCGDETQPAPFGVILFGDPYDDVDDPIDCSGVLALSGTWRFLAAPAEVNGVEFFDTECAYTIVADGWDVPDCDTLTDPVLLEEVLAHEMGHVLGLGHSAVDDAIMRDAPYGERGARLGDDDVDGAHCLYPHVFDVTFPDGGETLTAGGLHGATWTATADATDAGTVDVQVSTDGGASWIDVATATPNDGELSWIVPDADTDTAQVRVHRPLRLQPPPEPFPTACSGATSDGDFVIAPPAGPTGEVPDGFLLPGLPVRVREDADGVHLDWDDSCGTATGYAVYQGSLDALRQGSYDHAPLTCSTPDTTLTVPPPDDAAYYVVVPVQDGLEGTAGVDSDGLPRPAATDPCGALDATACEP